jgi:hypothetical protein
MPEEAVSGVIPSNRVRTNGETKDSGDGKVKDDKQVG